jgi:radical SAM-linked protein
MAGPPPRAPAEDVPRFRVALEYAIAGDLRFISHHDELRMLARVLVRADWPLRYSQGFNPIPRLVLPLPRSVGTASQCQWALVELREERRAQDLRDRLAAALPADCALKRMIAPAPRGKPHALAVEYAVMLDPRDAGVVGPRLRGMLALEELVVQRDIQGGKRTRRLDIRPHIESLVLDGPDLRMRLRIADQCTARPAEILTELGLAADVYNHRVRRTEVTWDIELLGQGVGPAAPEGMKLGNEEESNHHKTA